ncbi:hypothetical protein TAMA11512_14010 [Selenomonas sp. TAMA-11512]|uniref:hypothetical protein n=1 Tax=Selenomonas sp. TAMA-11512 TaxID=3095337 RepID=UPI0030903507|nr:hypothetical protein TAMA11512_14010 [Selenomonas sp. TAMA-11512]
MMNMRRQCGVLLAGIFLGWISFAGVVDAAEAEIFEKVQRAADSDGGKVQRMETPKKDEKTLSELRADDLIGTWVLAEELMEQLQSIEMQTLGQTIGEKIVESKSVDVVRSEMKKALENTDTKYQTKLVISKKGDALQADYKILSEGSLMPITSREDGNSLKWVKAEDYLVKDGIPWYLRLDGLQRLQKDQVKRGEIVLIPLETAFSMQDEIRHLIVLVPVHHLQKKKMMNAVEGKTLIFMRKEDVDNILIEATYAEIKRELTDSGRD